MTDNILIIEQPKSYIVQAAPQGIPGIQGPTGPTGGNSGVTYIPLTSIQLLDGQAQFEFYSFNCTTYNAAIIQWVASRGTVARIGGGTINVFTDGTAITLSDTAAELLLTRVGISFSAAILGTTAHLYYTTTSIGYDGTLGFYPILWHL